MQMLLVNLVMGWFLSWWSDVMVIQFDPLSVLFLRAFFSVQPINSLPPSTPSSKINAGLYIMEKETDSAL